MTEEQELLKDVKKLPDGYSSSAFIWLGTLEDGELFILGRLSDERMMQCAHLMPDSNEDRQGLLDAVGCLLHLSIGAQPLNKLPSGRAGLARIASRLMNMPNKQLLAAALQVVNFHYRDTEAHAFAKWAEGKPVN
jgi:hypothetical protein